MVDEIGLRRDMDRAAKARALLDDPLLSEAFDTLRQAYIDAILGSAAKDTDERERLWVATTVLTKVKGHLEQTIATGGVSAAILSDLQAKASRAKRA